MKFKKFLVLFLLINCSFIFSQSPIVSADGKQLYCPGTKLHVATSFSITPGGTETGQRGLYIQISQGYINGEDKLSLLNPFNFPNIDEDWSDIEGKLTLTHDTDPEILYAEIEALLLDVVFESSSANPEIDKRFSISIGDANYLPSEDHYYKYVPDPGIKWSEAKTKAEDPTNKYYGLQGYLATLRTLEEAILCGKQALGAGWIGASDASVEGRWEWVTGPEGIIPFWQGNGSGGPINGEYANWNDVGGANEPNDSGGNEDYGHITYNLGPGTVGKWNDLSNTGSTTTTSNYYPQGYVVEFGGSPGDPVINITDFTEIIMPRIIAPNPIVPKTICGPDTVTFNVQTNTLAPTDPLNDIEVQWYDSPTGLNLLGSGLSFTTPSMSGNTTYYALPVKFDGTTACSSTADRVPFEVVYYEKPELIVPSPQPFEQCNNTVFDLVALQPSLSINAATETFEFFDSSGTLIASPSSYTFTGSSTSNQETIIVKITSNSSIGLTPVCNTLTNMTLKLGACDIPSTFPVLPVAVCETSTDPLGGGQDGFETFDKSIFSNIEAALIAEEPLFDIFGTEINFFRSDADAQAGVSTTAIDKTVDYTTSAGQGFTFNTTENRWEQELWIRVENTTVSTTPLCFDTKKVATLYINKLPELINNSLPFEQCNNTVFDLVALQPSLSINAATETFEFFDSSGTLIASPSSYTFTGSSTSNQETISVTISSRPSLGTACNISANIMLKLGACDIPSTFPVLPVAVCETSTDPLGGGQDGFETFDKSIFSNIEAALIAEEPLFDIFGTEINFFRSDADAQAGVSTTAIDKTVDYTTSAGQGFTFNTTENRWEQELWIRVENTTVSTTPLCFDTKKVATLYINKLPELLRSFVPFNQCNLGIFNLTTKERELSSNYADEVFEYYDSTGTLITDPANYTAAGLNEIITVTINTTPSIGTACINTTASINLAWSVTTLPSAYTLIDEYLIETDPDLKGQGQDGIETFDKSIFDTVQADLIVAEPAFSGKTFSFYRSQNDALRTKDKIDTTIDFATDKQTNAGFTFNTAENRWEQQIWVYIEDNVTSAISTCYGLYHIATVYVEKRPVFYDVTVKEHCDEQTPLDMYSLFDTSLLFSEFTRDPTGSVAQNTSLFTVEYTYVDDTGAAVTLDPTLPSSFNSGDQTITVTLTNNSTNTTLPAGVSSGTIEFKVYQQPVAYPSDPSVAGVYTFEECDDDNDGLAAWRRSI